MDGLLRNCCTDRRKLKKSVVRMVHLYQIVFILIVVVFISVTSGFNLEPRVPVIKQGENGSYFGYSIAQHITQVGGRNLRHNRLIVGAPKLRESGGVFQCDITTNQSDCVELQIQDPEQAEDEIRKGQWLGVTIRSQGPGGFALACAHRYVKTPSEKAQWGYGICYTLTRNLDYDEVWIPCEGRSVSKAHEEFGYCQTGTSGAILEDNTALFGSPGPYTWRGTVFSNNVQRGISDDLQWYFGPLDADSPVDKYSYLGMSVTAGRFIDNSVSYVAGAPRSNGTGEVVFFKKIPAAPPLNVQLILSGDTFASSFGYELASIDLNNDTFLDLVVGAPFYYGKEAGGAIYVYMNSADGITRRTLPIKITGKPDSRFGFALANLKDLNQDGYEDLAVGAPYEDKGVVYIYLGTSEGITRDGVPIEPSQVIRSQDLPGVPVPTFGYSLSGGLDMDNNGYPDLLVGAYEANRVILLRARPIINIHTKVEGDLLNIDPNKRGCIGADESNYVCFNIRTCFKLAARSSSGRLAIKYLLIAEAFDGKQFSRVNFHRSINQPLKYIINETIIVDDSALPIFRCENERVFVRDHTQDILNPIRFKLSYSLRQDAPRPEREGASLFNINTYPILNQQEATRIFQVTFAKDCGDNDKCESDLTTKAHLNLKEEQLFLGLDKEVTLNVTVSNRNESAYEAAVYIEHPISLSYIGFRPESLLPCTPFNKTVITCPLGNPFMRGASTNIMLRFNPSGVKDYERSLTFVVKSNSTSTELTPEDDKVISAKIFRKVELDIGGSAEEQVFYGGEIKGESAIKTEDQVGSHVTHIYQVFNRGPWKVGTISVVVSWPYEVENNKKHGKWLLYLMEKPMVDDLKGECFIDPSRVNPLKLGKPSSEAFNENMQNDAAVDYDYGETSTGVFGSRKKRELIVMPEEVEHDGATKKVVTMDCLRNTAKCFEFTCDIYNLGSNLSAVIRIRARLWNSTFVEDYPNVHWVVIRSRARIELDPELDIEQDPSNDQAVAETKAQPDILVSQTIEDVPIWIIIVAVCAGVLLLVIIIIVLWKLGFFRRKKHEAMVKGNLEKQPHETNNVDH